MSIYREPVVADFWQLYRNPDGTYLDPMGPKNCTTHSMARAIMRHHEGIRPPGITGVWPPTGYAVRKYTGDTIGGTNLSQMDAVGQQRYGMNLDVRYKMAWPDFLEMLEETRGAILQLWYRKIRDSYFRGSTTFYQNHAIWVNGYDRDRRVLTGTVDPLADGRYAGIYRGPGDYPEALLKAAAGELNIARDGYQALGYGLVYAGFTRPTGGGPIPLPDTSTNPINYGATPMNLLDGPTAQRLIFGTGKPRKMFLKKGTVVYRSPSPAGTQILDRVGADVYAVMTGIPADGWRTVIISTRNFPDGIRRDVEAYVPKSAGPIA